MKDNFPIFKNNPNLVYLDSTATTQKPSLVIDWIKEYLENNYANIHRWSYKISENSEELYIKSKQKFAEFINANDRDEVIYSMNSTYSSNFFIQSLANSNYFSKWDKVLLTITEHHSNIVPWLILKEKIWIKIEYINITKDYDLDLEDLQKKLDANVKAVSITHVPNTTWEIYDLEKVWKIIKNYNENIFFMVDGSQSIPHIKFDVKKILCDAMFCTGHKFMANSGIWILRSKKSILKNLIPCFSGWGAILNVNQQDFSSTSKLPDKFEPWTPNLTWAISLLKALEYIENIWGFEKIEEIERPLIEYTQKEFNKIDWIKIIWTNNTDKKVWVFSFVVEWIHSLDISDYLADYNICIRAWQHCAEPFLTSLWINHTCRLSLYIYNDILDLEKFFHILKNAIKDLRI